MNRQSSFSWAARLPVFPLALLAVLAGPVAAGGAPAETPVTSVEDLPPGSLRDQVTALPPKAQEQALRNLRELGIPVRDYPLLRVDQEGNLFYEERGLLPDQPPEEP